MIAERPGDWASLLAIASPGEYLLAFGETLTVHRLACAIEDAGWIIRDMLVHLWGTPDRVRSRPIVLARKPGPLQPLQIDAARIGTGGDKGVWPITGRTDERGSMAGALPATETDNSTGRWPANVVLTDPIFDGGWDGVVGGGEAGGHGVGTLGRTYERDGHGFGSVTESRQPFDLGDAGTYSRFFLVPDLMAHLRALVA